MCFFFQAEDGIRDWSVTGVQTCALPISFRRIGLAGKANLAGILSDEAGENVQKRALPRAVLADEYVHFAGSDRQVDAIERDCRAKSLLDAAQLQKSHVRTDQFDTIQINPLSFWQFSCSHRHRRR